jgi:EAL domain-containing protein (putative c-di-GMP-specific phosphodiesterase class I)/GGDEF domain-containing protein
MQLALPRFIHASRPRGLQARAAAFVVVLMALSGATSAGIFIIGVERQGATALAFALLAPMLLVAGAWLTARFVRQAIAPLGQLTAHAERIADQGHASPMEIRTGDEFETLASAFNLMVGRLDASMRQIQEIAFVDPATRLPNQERFLREVNLFALQNQGAAAALVTIELSRLPKILQTLDSEAAREFVRVVAERVGRAVRAVDRVVRLRRDGDEPAVLARLGPAEFGVFAPGVESASVAGRYAQQLLNAIEQPFEWRGHKFALGAFGGLAMFPRDGRDASAIVRCARTARGAAQGAATHLKAYTPSLDRAAAARMTLEREIRKAIDNNEFRAFFQPKINLLTGRIEGCEALARWVREDRAIVSPARFVPVAEETGQIGPLSDAILREACWKAAAWARSGLAAKVAVNVSALQFASERFADNVLRIVQRAGLDPKHLELEITESVVMADSERALRLIAPLREAGVRLAIDDFGCGHSNLAALSRLPFDVIKIDQQFVRGLQRKAPQADAIVDMILALARTLNMEVVAEGVERREEARFMAERGCQWAQGFLYGAAVSAPEFTELLRGQGAAERAA